MDLVLQNLLVKAAAGTAENIIWAPPNATDVYRLEALSYVPNATSAANGTNYATVRPYGGSTALAAARTTASVDLTAATAENVTFTDASSARDITQANPLKIAVTHAASGVAVNLTVMAQLSKRRTV